MRPCQRMISAIFTRSGRPPPAALITSAVSRNTAGLARRSFASILEPEVHHNLSTHFNRFPAEDGRPIAPLPDRIQGRIH